MKTQFAFPLLTALVLVTFPVQAAGRLIQPGRSIGSVSLGETRSKVQKTLGRPSKTSSYKGGLIESRWNSGSQTPAGFQNYLSVMFKSGKVVQVKVTSSAFSTPAGVSTASALSFLKQTYGNMRNVWYSYDSPSPYRATYYDSVQSGIAFVQNSHNDWEESAPPDAIIVHRAGKGVIALPGWSFVNSDN